MTTEYEVDNAVSKIGNKSEEMKQIEIAATYNYYLSMSHYMPHLEQLETMKNAGDITEMSNLEVSLLHQGDDALVQAHQEIGDLSEMNYIENGQYSRIVTQFSWGCRSNPPFLHSSDALNSIVATMAKLGK